MTAAAKPRNVELEWRYVAATLAAFVFTPELRRLLDWNGHFTSIDVISPLPLAMLLPIAWIAFRNRGRIAGTPFVWIVGLWLTAFGYGVLSGYVQKVLIAGIYGFALYVLPLSVAAWVMTLDARPSEILRRLSSVLLALGGISGAYGVIQFVVAPPWDTAWMINVDAHSFGEPVPFGIRVFGVLNSPGVFADFLASCIIISVSQIDLRRLWQPIAVVAMLVSLMLTLVRTSWLEVALALTVLAVLHPQRIRAVSSIVLLGVLCVAGLAGFLAFSPDETFKLTFQTRLSTFGSLTEDGSAMDRANSADGALRASLANPQGVGLGFSGVSSKLIDLDERAFQYEADPAIDNGYLSRLYELGFFGFAAFLATLATGLTIAATSYARAGAAGRTGDLAIVAISIACQIGTAGSLFGGDVIEGLGGAIYFIMVALPVVVARSATGTNATRGVLSTPRGPVTVR